MHMRNWIITFLAASNVVLICLLLLSGRSDANDLVNSYRGLSIGDPESKLVELTDQQDFFRVGTVEQTAEGYTWTWDWVKDGPIEYELTRDDLVKNVFWQPLGWAYPTHALSDHVVVIGERGSSDNFIYAYLNSSKTIIAIYIGGT